MNITMIGPFPPPRSGTSIKNEVLKNELVRLGVEVCSINTIQKKWRALLSLINFTLSLRRKNMIIAVSKNGRAALLPYAFIIKRIFGKRVFLLPCGGSMCDELLEMPKLVRDVLLVCCRSLDGIFVETKKLRSDLSELLVNKEVNVLCNFKQRPPVLMNKYKSNDSIKLIYLGRIKPEKGIFVLVDAVNRLANDQNYRVSLDVYGDFLPGDMETKQHFDNVVSESKHVTYKGYLNASEIQSTLTSYSALVFPTFYEGEGFPGVLIDAAFAGLPVIATDIRYNSEIIENGINGVLCKPYDVNSLVDAIMKLYSNPDALESMGKKNWEKSIEFDSQLAAKKLLAKMADVGTTLS